MTIVSPNTIIENKLKNEEYKIWKKVVPSLYQHIITFKPIFNDIPFDQIENLFKCITFTDKIVNDSNSNGTATTSVFCSLGDKIYEFDFSLPLGAYDTTNTDSPLPDPKYNDHEISYITEETKYNAKWVWPGETIIKLIALSEKKFLALSRSGSIAVFQDGTQSPFGVVIDTSTERSDNIIIDMDISKDLKSIIKTKSNLITRQTIVEIIDNGTTWGNKVVSISLNDIIINQILFLNNGNDNTESEEKSGMIALDDNNRVCIWNSMSQQNQEPNYTLKLENNVSHISISPFIPTLFALGFVNSSLRFYDIRNIMAQDPSQVKENCLFELNHLNEDPVTNIMFSKVSPFELLSIGQSGNIYHWNLEYIFNQVNKVGFEDIEGEFINPQEIQSECLTFYHTGGARRSFGFGSGKNSVSYHPLIDDFVATVDKDGLFSVYKPCIGRYLPDVEPENNEDNNNNNSNINGGNAK